MANRFSNLQGRIVVAPANPGSDWLSVYDDEFELPGPHLLGLGKALSRLMETTCVAFNVGDMVFAAVIVHGEHLDSVDRPLPEEDQACSRRLDCWRTAVRSVDNLDALARAWNAETFSELHAVAPQLIRIGDSELCFPLQRTQAIAHVLDMLGERADCLTGLNYMSEEDLTAPGFSVIRFDPLHG